MPGARRYASAEAELWRYPLAGPTGGSGITAVDVIVVSLEDSGGETGLGFSYVLGGGGAVVKAAAGDLLARLVAGEDCAPPETLWRRLAASLNRVGRGIGYVAIAAIDVAAWDLHARALGVPLYTALGGAARTVPVYGSGGFRPDQDPDAAVAQALAYAGRGCKAVKLRLAGNRADAERMRAVAAALPGGVDLMVDANERCDLAPGDLARQRMRGGQRALAGGAVAGGCAARATPRSPKRRRCRSPPANICKARSRSNPIWRPMPARCSSPTSR